MAARRRRSTRLPRPTSRATATASGRRCSSWRPAPTTRVAIPLADVARLEEIPVSTRSRHTRGRDVVQYRGDILPLVRVSELVGGYGGGQVGEHITVVVHAWRGRQIGIIVDRIVDIVEIALPDDSRSRSRPRWWSRTGSRSCSTSTRSWPASSGRSSTTWWRWTRERHDIDPEPVHVLAGRPVLRRRRARRPGGADGPRAHAGALCAARRGRA